jgi:two-component system, OmpR family, response regulator MprA
VVSGETVSTRGAILVGEGDERFRTYVVELLEGAGFQAVPAADGRELLRFAGARRPRLVLLDVAMPVLCGYEVLQRLREQYGLTVPIIFVTGTRTEPHDRAGGLLAGADDYIVKPFAADEFLARVRALLRRAEAGTSTADAVPRLTKREREVLAELADGRSQAEIARRLRISPKTVGTHVEHIFRKLRVRNRAQAIGAARRARLITD